MSTVTKKRLIAAAILIALFLAMVACSTAPAGPGPSAQQAELNYHMTATAEVAVTATAVEMAAQAKLAAGYRHATEMAQAGVQSTLTAQEQAMNDAVLANLQLRATEQSNLARISATESILQATEQSYFRTATVVAVQDAQSRAEMGTRLVGWTTFALFGVGAILGFGGVLLLFWRFYTKHSFIPAPDGKGGVVVEASPIDPIRHLLGQPARSKQKFSLLLPAPVEQMRSADPAAEPAPFMVRSGKQIGVQDLNQPTKREQQWEVFRKQTVVNFCTVLYEYAKANGKLGSTRIERWETLKEFDIKRAYINSRWWTLVTDALEEQKVIAPKRQGVETTLIVGGPASNVAELFVLAVRDRLFPAAPPSWFQLEEVSQPGNSDSSAQLEQLAQPEQSPSRGVDWQPPPDDPIWGLPGN